MITSYNINTYMNNDFIINILMGIYFYFTIRKCYQEKSL